MAARIIDRGRGPEIESTRITVFDVLDYRKHGWHRDRIAALFRLSSTDVQAELDYIEEHQADVMESYRRLLDRHRQHVYSPEVEARLAQCRGIATARLAEIRARRRHEVTHAGDHA
jgi:uncharacterized protein (DUF433 family)